MRKKIMAISIFIMFVVLALGYFMYKKYSISNNLKDFSLVEKDKYDATYESKEAVKKYNINKRAELIQDVDIKSNVIALTFEGVGNREITEEILDLLDLYDVKSTFIITGVEAGEDGDLVKKIMDDGHDIGSGTLSGKKEMQNLSKEDLISDFSTANKILNDITNENIRILKCNSTVYSNELLASAYAAGNRYVISPNYYLNYESFNNYEEVRGYVKKLSKGSIISIKLDGVLDDFEYDKTNKEENPAIDKEANITEIKKQDSDITIANIVEWILSSITEEKITPIQVKKLTIIDKSLESNYEEDNAKPTINYNIINNYNKETIKEEVKVPIKEEPNKNQVDNVVSNDIDFKKLIEKNNHELTPIVSKFFTTEEVVTYTFRGLSNDNVLDNILMTLNRNNTKGTFFVTKEEIENYPDRIDKIIKEGHEIANGGITSSSKILSESTEEICKEIYEVDKLLKEKGIYTNAYMAGYGYINSNIQEATSTIKQIEGLKDYELINYTKTPIVEKYKDMSAVDIVNDYFNINSYVSLNKGEIVYFRLDSEIFNEADKISDIIDILTDRYVKNGYVHKINKETNSYDTVQIPLNYNVVSIKNVQSNIENKLNYGRYNILSNFKTIQSVSNDKVSELIKTNYIGNEDVVLDGFTNEEIGVINKNGTINTNGEDVIFLTFDDWGGDPILNSILDVLDKHKVKASFFVISRYIDLNGNLSNSNPNMLRTIALNGHDIGSHTYNHDILNSNKDDLLWSLTESYNSMSRIIGDLGSLKEYFRPPTLHVNKTGLSTVFESGYKYSISGNISTRDYEKNSSEELVKSIEDGLVDGVGNIVIMHMNNQSYYTAEALDKFLTNNENGVYGKKYKIAKLSDYLAN